MCNMMINTLWNDYLDKVSYINHLTDLPFFMYVVRTFKQMFSCCCSCCSVTQLCPPLRCLAFLSFTISRSLLKLMSIESVMPSNYLILCCPLLLLPSIFPLSTSSSAFNLSQHQDIFRRVDSSPQVTKVLQLQHNSIKGRGKKKTERERDHNWEALL